MKPHEERLEVVSYDKERSCLIASNRMVAVLRAFEANDWEKLLSAAPDMARALLAMGKDRNRDGKWHVYGCTGDQSMRACDEECIAAVSALKKAGVLP